MQLLFLSGWLTDAVSKAIGWTLFHSLWQGILAAIAAGIIIIATRRSSARLRYNLLGMVFIVLMLTVLITFTRYIGFDHSPAKTVNSITGEVTNIQYNNIESPSATIPPALPEKFTTFFDDHAELFVLTWALFFLFHSIKLITGLAGIQRVRNYKRQVTTSEWELMLQELAGKLGIKQTVHLFQSELVKVPVAIGYLKPVILVPLGLLSWLPPDQAETILLHELAHIRRHDYLVNVLQRITEAVFFFNPALLWISSLIRQEREACCDDIVMANTDSKGSYLEALVSFQEYSFSAGAYAMAISQNRNYLLNRVKRMITRENKKLNLMEKIILVISLLTVTAFTWIPAKEAVAKKPVTGQTAIVQTMQPEQAVVVQTEEATSLPDRTSIKKELPVAILLEKKRDTVPPKKVNVEEVKFKSISTQTDDDLTNRKETITAIDENGKKYTISKLNDKITSLSINEKKIPESELESYSPLLDRLGHIVTERHALIDRIREKRMVDGRERVYREDNYHKERVELLEKIQEEQKVDRERAAKDREELRFKYEKLRKEYEKERKMQYEKRDQEMREYKKELDQRHKEMDEKKEDKENKEPEKESRKKRKTGDKEDKEMEKIEKDKTTYAPVKEMNVQYAGQNELNISYALNNMHDKTELTNKSLRNSFIHKHNSLFSKPAKLFAPAHQLKKSDPGRLHSSELFD